MKILAAFPTNGFARCRAMMLIECLVYFSVGFVVLAVAFAAFYKVYDVSKGLRRTTDDIGSAIRTGERWREDIRTAAAPPRAAGSTNEQLLDIPHQSGVIHYRFAEGALWRRTDDAAAWTQVLSGVKSSRMFADPHGRVAAWRWELELQSHRQSVRVRPLFTFAAVPSTASAL